MGIYDLWQEAVKELSVARRQRETKSGITFHMGGIRLDNLMHSGSHSVVIEEKSSKIRITFYPASIHLCWNEFQIHKEQVPFQFEEPKNARPTERVSQQWYCVLNKEDWETHKEMLTSLARTVCNTWEKTRKETAG